MGKMKQTKKMRTRGHRLQQMPRRKKENKKQEQKRRRRGGHRVQQMPRRTAKMKQQKKEKRRATKMKQTNKQKQHRRQKLKLHRTRIYQGHVALCWRRARLGSRPMREWMISRTIS